jgi:hypothetical protein
MFYRRDPFANVADLMSSSDVSSSDESDDNEHKIGSAAHSVTPVLATPDLPLAPEPANSSGAVSNDVAEALKSAFDTVAEYSEATPGAKSAESPCPGEGWYVVFHGGLPGVFFGV